MKLLLEFAIFAGILCQISLLTARVNGPDAPPPTIESVIESVSTAGPGIVAAGTGVYDPSVLQEMARQEAQRIVDTGDVESLQRHLGANKDLLESAQGPDL